MDRSLDKTSGRLVVASQLLNAFEYDSEEYHFVTWALEILIASRPGLMSVLEQLILHGPVHDGDVISKADRDELLALGLACRVVCKGEQGYTAATYSGWHSVKGFKWHPRCITQQFEFTEA